MTPADAACVACGGTAYSEIPYPREGVSAPSICFDSIRICAACGLGQALPPHSQQALDAFYASGEYRADGGVAPDARQQFHERNQCRHRVEVALPYAGGNPGRVLDVGAGHGWIADWLIHARPGHRWSYDYIEPDGEMSALIERRVKSPGLRRLRGWGDAAPAYDLIFLNHVLEHVADPLDLLRDVKGKLAPGAVAYVEVPHADYRFKRNVFPHTFFFTPEALSRLGVRAALAVVRCEVFGCPPAGVTSLPLRAAYRLAATTGLRSFSGWLDDRLWGYEPARDGMWIRWVITSAA